MVHIYFKDDTEEYPWVNNTVRFIDYIGEAYFIDGSSKKAIFICCLILVCLLVTLTIIFKIRNKIIEAIK